MSGVGVDFGVREPHGLAQRAGVGDFGSGAVSDVVADYEHLISEPDLRPVQIVESNLQRLGLDRIGPKFVRRLHVTARFDDNLSGFGLPQIGLGHLGHEAGGFADHDDTREAQQLLRVGELLLGVSSCGYDTGSSWWCGPRGACGDKNEGVQDRFVTNDMDTLATALYATTDDTLVTGRADEGVIAGPPMGYEDVAPLPVIVTEAGGWAADLGGASVLEGDMSVLVNT